jgi:hypothetical protein
VVVARSGYIDAFKRDSGAKLWTQELKGFGRGRASLGVPGNVRLADQVE